MNNMPDKNNLIDAIVASSGGKINKTAAKNAANGDLSGVLGALSPEEQNKLKALLADEGSARQLLSSPAAKKLLEMFVSGGKGNG